MQFPPNNPVYYTIPMLIFNSVVDELIELLEVFSTFLLVKLTMKAVMIDVKYDKLLS